MSPADAPARENANKRGAALVDWSVITLMQKQLVGRRKWGGAAPELRLISCSGHGIVDAPPIAAAMLNPLRVRMTPGARSFL